MKSKNISSRPMLSAAGNKINTKSSNNSKEIQIVDNNPDHNELSRNRTWVDYMDEEATVAFIGKNGARKRLMYTMLKRSAAGDYTEAIAFLNDYKICKNAMFRLCEDYPDVKESWIQFLENIASTKRHGALIRKYDKDVTFKDMHLYDKGWNINVNKYWKDLNELEVNLSLQTLIGEQKIWSNLVEGFVIDENERHAE